MIQASICALGSEILSGTITNTNAVQLSRHLLSAGIDVSLHASAPDKKAKIFSVLDYCLSLSDMVLITGGLGPTFDDITRQAVADYVRKPLFFSASQAKALARKLAGRKLEPEYVQCQCSFPKGAVIFNNGYGIAPGFGICKGRKWLFVMPGVPREAEGMFVDQILPFIKKQYSARACRMILTARILGLKEVEVLEKLGAAFPPRDVAVDCGIYPRDGEVWVRMKRLRAGKESLSAERARWKKYFRQRLGKSLIAFDENLLEETVLRKAERKQQGIAVAESISGGLLAKRFTDIAGASKIFRGGWVVYQDAAKEKFAGIPSAFLKKFGAVSEETTRALAVSVRRRAASYWGIALTGYAGPRGNKNDIGRVYISLASPRACETRSYRFKGSREKIRWLAAQNALRFLWEKMG